MYKNIKENECNFLHFKGSFYGAGSQQSDLSYSVTPKVFAFFAVLIMC